MSYVSLSGPRTYTVPPPRAAVYLRRISLGVGTVPRPDPACARPSPAAAALPRPMGRHH